MGFSAAGVMPKGSYNGSDYYYFGVDKKNEITTFCGKKSAGESNAKCAAREFDEESLGALISKKKIDSILKKHVPTIANHAVKQITFMPTLKIKGNPIKKFAEKRWGKKAKKLNHSQKEMTKIVAIEKNQLRNLANSNQHYYQGSQFRGDAWGTIKLAVNAKLI